MNLAQLRLSAFRAAIKALESAGFGITRLRAGVPTDFDEATAEIYRTVRPYTMTSAARVHALCTAVRHVVRNDIPGDIVECGVWRGGSMMAAALTLIEMGDTQRCLWLFDTFEGMPPPGDIDRRFDGAAASQLLDGASQGDRASVWCVAGIDDVRANLCSTGYPQAGINYVEGRVEETIPRRAPDRIAVLRLDTDWYESTRHELVELYPRLSPGGVLVIDDYGFWQGARRAVDEYLKESGAALLLHRVDETGRVALKPR